MLNLNNLSKFLLAMDFRSSYAFYVNILFTKSLYKLFTNAFFMSDVIAIRVPKKLKDDLQELSLDYADEVRECLEKKVKIEKLKRALKEIDAFRKELDKKTGITLPSAEIIREDRDHGH